MVHTMIRITRGGCGIKYTDGNGVTRYACKTPEDGPFMCEIEQAKRLVELGVAAYVATADKVQTAGSQEPEKVIGHFDAAQLEAMDYNELKKLAADMDVKPDGQKKADYIAAILAGEVEIDGESVIDDEGDELPDLSVADPE